MFTISRNTTAFYQHVSNYRSLLEQLPSWMLFNDGLFRDDVMTEAGDVATVLAETLVARDGDKTSKSQPRQHNLHLTGNELLVQNLRSRVMTAVFDTALPGRTPQLLADPVIFAHQREQMGPELLQQVETLVILFHTLRNRLGIVRRGGDSYEGLDRESVIEMLAQNAYLIKLGKVIAKPKTNGGDALIFKAEVGTWTYSRQLVLRWGYSNHFAELQTALYTNYAGRVGTLGSEYIPTLPALSREDEMEVRNSLWLFHARYLNALLQNTEFSTAANHYAANATAFAEDLLPASDIALNFTAQLTPYNITKQLASLLAGIDLIGRRLAKMDGDSPNRHSDLQAFLKMLRTNGGASVVSLKAARFAKEEQ